MVDGVSVYLCEVVCVCLKYNVCVVIFVYNYFSGVVEFSVVDCVIIYELCNVLQLVGVCVFDYLVIGLGELVLMVVCGLIQLVLGLLVLVGEVYLE